MSDPTPKKSEREILPEPVASRVLERAIELDRIRASGTSVAELRAVAGEVGVSAGAFDAALAELDHRKDAPLPAVPAKASRRFWIAALFAAVLAFVAISTMYLFPRRIIESQAAASKAPMEEEAFVLRCLSPDEAADLVRPLLHFFDNAIVIRPPNLGSRVLTVRATAEQLKQVKSVLDEQQAAGSAACAARPTPAPK